MLFISVALTGSAALSSGSLAAGNYQILQVLYHSDGQGHACVQYYQTASGTTSGYTVLSSLPSNTVYDGMCLGGQMPAGNYQLDQTLYSSNGQGRVCILSYALSMQPVAGYTEVDSILSNTDISGFCSHGYMPLGHYQVGQTLYYSNGEGRVCTEGYRPDPSPSPSAIFIDRLARGTVNNGICGGGFMPEGHFQMARTLYYSDGRGHRCITSPAYSEDLAPGFIPVDSFPGNTINVGFCDQGPAAAKSRWTHPNCTWSDATQSAADCQDMFNKSSSWSNVLSNTNVYQFFYVAVKENYKGTIDQAIPILQQHGIAIAIEGTAVHKEVGCDSQTGMNSAKLELKEIQHVYDIGGSINYIALDDPVWRMMDPKICNFSESSAIEQLVQYMKTFHSARPYVKFGLVVNFVYWSYGNFPSYAGGDFSRGDYRQVLEDILLAVNAAGERIEFVHADNPYEYAVGIRKNGGRGVSQIDWIQRLLDLESQVESHQIDFGLIYNSEPTANSSDELFFNNTLTYLSLYESRGGHPADRIIESWYDKPSLLVPEDKPYTFMNLIKSTLPKPQ